MMSVPDWLGDYEAVARLMREYQLEYLLVRQGERSIEMSMPAAAAASDAPTVIASHADGIFMRQHEGQDGPLATEGDRVKAGDLLALVASGPLFSVIRAPRSGTVSRFLAAHGEAVSPGTKLLHLL